jgi:hypothetical protein
MRERSLYLPTTVSRAFVGKRLRRSLRAQQSRRALALPICEQQNGKMRP